MKIVRQLILALSFLMGLWVIGSFVGVMVNLGNAAFWTTSLMWSLLASVLIMPMLVVLHHANKRTERRATQAEQAAPSLRKQPPFIEEEEREEALWPESEAEHTSNDR